MLSFIKKSRRQSDKKSKKQKLKQSSKKNMIVDLEVQESLRTADTTDTASVSNSTLNSTLSLSPTKPSSDASLCSLRHIAHSRRFSLINEDYDGLIVQSRGYRYDPTGIPTLPHHDRERARAMSQNEYDKFIFAARVVRPDMGRNTTV